MNFVKGGDKFWGLKRFKIRIYEKLFELILRREETLSGSLGSFDSFRTSREFRQRFSYNRIRVEHRKDK